MLYGEINRQRLKIVREHVVADTIDYLEARFAFSEDWDGLEKWVHFAKDGEVYDIRLTDDCIRKEDHLNLSAGIWKVYLHGNEFSGGKVIERITTNAAILKVEPTGALDGEPFPEMPASVTEQILARLEDIEQNGGGSGGQQAQVDDTLTKPGYAADAKAVGDKLGEVSETIADKADKTLKSADGDSWEVAVESGGDVVTHKTSGAVEIVAESLKSATFFDKVLTLTGITGTYVAVIIPDATEISIDVPANVAVNPDFADPVGWQTPSFGWFFLRTDSGYIAAHTTNRAEVYKVSADLKTWTSISGGIENVAQNTMRVVLDNGTATVYSDDIATYSVDGITGIGYAASGVKVLTIYGMTVIHRQSGGSEVDLSEVNNRLDALDKAIVNIDKTLTIEGAAADAKAVGDKIKELSGGNPNGGGISTRAVNLLITILQNVALYDTNQLENIGALQAELLSGAGSGGEDNPDTVMYTVTNNLSKVSNSNPLTRVEENSAYSAVLTASEGYTLEGAIVTVTMNGVDITATAYTEGVVIIEAVTGNVVISASAVLDGVIYTLPAPVSNETGTPDTSYIVNTGINISDPTESKTITFSFTPNENCAASAGNFSTMLCSSGDGTSGAQNAVCCIVSFDGKNVQFRIRDSGGANTTTNLLTGGALGDTWKCVWMYDSSVKAYTYKAISVNTAGAATNVVTKTADISTWELEEKAGTMIVGGWTKNNNAYAMTNTTVHDMTIYNGLLDDNAVAEYLTT